MQVLTAEAMWSIPRVGAPVAVAGERLVVPVTSVDPDTDEATTALWRVDPATGDALLFTSGDPSGPTANHDGTAIAYLKRVGDHRQVHVQPLDGGEGSQAADLPLGAVGVRWMPDGRLLALATLWAGHPDLDATSEHEPDEHVTARATETAVFQYWDSWLDHVYHPVVIDPATGEVTDLTPGSTAFWRWPNTDQPIDDLDVSPDGSLVAFTVDDSPASHRELSWSLFVMRSDGTELRRLDWDRPGHSRRPRFGVDGRRIVYGYQPESDYYASPTALVSHDLASGDEVELAPDWDRSPSGWLLEADDTLVFTTEDEGRNRLWRLPWGAAEPEPLTDGGWLSDPVVSALGTIHVLSHSLSSPPEIHQVGTDGTRPVTEFTRLSTEALAFGTVREMHVDGGNDDAVQMFVVDPPGAAPDASLPLVHMIHGGPHSSFGDAWHWRWNVQVVAAAGYRVALVNFHGSTGWGDSFARSIHGRWGDLPLQDIEAATDHLVAAGLADPERMAVTGGSYGGYLAAWITSQTDRYSCAVAHAAVTNLGGMYASDITHGRARAYGAEVWDDRSAIDRWSPSAHATGYSTPTLVVHGYRDARVPVTQGLELYGVLVAKGVPARLVTYPSQNHWILSRADSIRWYEEFLGWLNRWI